MRGDEFFLKIASRPPLSKLHPSVAAFFKDYLSGEKATRFGDRYVVNTHMPPYPGRAFDCMMEQVSSREGGRLFSVTFAVTNRCRYDCWHCYNAGRSQKDMPLEEITRIAAQLQDLGAAIVTLTGGEPLLRKDLGEIAEAFDDRTSLVLGTTGAGLTHRRAAALAQSGVFAVGVSVDSSESAEHDRMRGRAGAFDTAIGALETAREAGMFPYVVSLATREFVEPERFYPFMEFVRDAGALEVHLLEPVAAGRLHDREDVLIGSSERTKILEYQREFSARMDMPTVSTFAHIESADAFGCGAGLTHLYIDGSGEVCPCNLIPMSFGNVTREPLNAILARMGRHFKAPRCTCAARVLAGHIPGDDLPTPPDASEEICRRNLPPEHGIPRFFKVREAALSSVGATELAAAYNGVHGDYDEFWLAEAAGPVDELVERLKLEGRERVFEAGCGTGYATAVLARALKKGGTVTAVDLSEGMLQEAERRIEREGFSNVTFQEGDALEALDGASGYELVFSSWVLGYIELRPFFASAARALVEGGRLAFVVHRENSPAEPLEIFAGLVAEEPSVLTRQVAFDFPPDASCVESLAAQSGLEVAESREGSITFRYGAAEEVLEHLLKSGAGTAFYEALREDRREDLSRRFIEELSRRHRGSSSFDVVHDYVALIASKREDAVKAHLQ